MAQSQAGDGEGKTELSASSVLMDAEGEGQESGIDEPSNCKQKCANKLHSQTWSPTEICFLICFAFKCWHLHQQGLYGCEFQDLQELRTSRHTLN